MTGHEYNYDAFNFSLEEGAYPAWLRTAPALGQLAPDFTLSDLEGHRHRLTDLRGRPVVIEFGSYTCPIFCAQIPPMRALSTRHPDAAFLVIYTREAHPGEKTPSHANSAAKELAARRLAAEEHLGRTLLIDDLDGSTHRAYGQAWDSVFVLDDVGRVVLRRAWNNPQHVDATLKALAAGESPTPIESVDMAAFIEHGGTGHGLLRGGPQALLDFYRSAPPPARQRLEQSESTEVQRLLNDQ